MEKLIHKPTGELVTENPFRVLGIELRYGKEFSDRQTWHTGVVTKEALACYDDPKYRFVKEQPVVWANWRNARTPSFVRLDDYIVEIVS